MAPDGVLKHAVKVRGPPNGGATTTCSAGWLRPGAMLLVGGSYVDRR
jgi:hypothetical protein